MYPDSTTDRPTPAEVVQLLTRIAPDPWDPYLCLDRLIELRGRPIVLAQAALPEELVTTALRTCTTDYVFIPPMQIGRDRSTIVTHGLAHVLLAHAMPRLDDRSLTSRGHVADGPYCGYSPVEEQEAEKVAEAFVATLTLPAAYDREKYSFVPPSS